MENFNSYDPNTIKLMVTQLESVTELLKEKAIKETVFYRSFDVNEALLFMTGHGYPLSEAHIYQFVVDFFIPFELVHGKFLFDKEKFTKFFNPEVEDDVPTLEQVLGLGYLAEKFKEA